MNCLALQKASIKGLDYFKITLSNFAADLELRPSALKLRDKSRSSCISQKKISAKSSSNMFYRV